MHKGNLSERITQGIVSEELTKYDYSLRKAVKGPYVAEHGVVDRSGTRAHGPQ